MRPKKNSEYTIITLFYALFLPAVHFSLLGIPIYTKFTLDLLLLYISLHNIFNQVCVFLSIFHPKLVMFTLSFLILLLYTYSSYLLVREYAKAESMILLSTVPLLITLLIWPLLNYGYLADMAISSLLSLIIVATLIGRRAFALLPVVAIFCPAYVLPVFILFTILYFGNLEHSRRKDLLFPSILAITLIMVIIGFYMHGDYYIVLNNLMIRYLPQCHLNVEYWLLLLLAVVVSTVYLRLEEQAEVDVPVVWIVSSTTILLFHDNLCFLCFTVVPLTYIIALSLMNLLRKTVIKLRTGNEVIFEINIPRVLALVIMVFAITSLALNITHSVASYLNSNSILLDELNELLEKTNIDSKGYVIADPPLIPWLIILKGAKIPSTDIRVLEAWSSTVFRLENQYVVVDEWSPIITSRNPRISVFNGATYVPLLYLNDAYIRLHLSVNNKTWIVSIDGMQFVNYSISRDRLVLKYLSTWVNVTRKITLHCNKPEVLLEYVLKLRREAKISKIEYYIWAEYGKEIEIHKTYNSKILLQISGVRILIEKPKNAKAYIKLGEPGKQDYLRILLNTENKSLYTLKINLKILTAKRNKLVKCCSYNLFDFMKKNGEKYVLAFKKQPILFSEIKAKNDTLFYTISSFNTVKVLHKVPANIVHISDSYVRSQVFVRTGKIVPIIEVYDNETEVVLQGKTTLKMNLTSFSSNTSHRGEYLETKYKYRNVVITRRIFKNNSEIVFHYLQEAGENLRVKYKVTVRIVGYNATVFAERNKVVLETAVGLIEINVENMSYVKGIYNTYKIVVCGEKELKIVLRFQTSPTIQMRQGKVMLVSEKLIGPWIEAPAGGYVLSENYEENKVFLKARTAGLIIVKNVTSMGNYSRIYYYIKPIEGKILGRVYMYLWLDFNPEYYVISLGNSSVSMFTVNITFTPKPLKLSLIREKEYNAPVIYVEYVPVNNEAYFMLEVSGNVNVSYFKAPRPVMEGGDIVAIKGILLRRETIPLVNASFTVNNTANSVDIKYVNNQIVYYEEAKVGGRGLSFRVKVNSRTREVSIAEISKILWVSSQRDILEISGNEILTDAGPIEILMPSMLKSKFKLHKIYGQFYIEFTYKVPGIERSKVDIKINIVVSRKVFINAHENIAEFIVKVGYFEKVCESSNLALFKQVIKYV